MNKDKGRKAVAFDRGDERALCAVSSSVRKAILRFRGRFACAKTDYVVEEACFQLRLDGRVVDEFTCSPWGLEELAVGRLYSRGLIESWNQLSCVTVDEERGVLDVCKAAEARPVQAKGTVIPFADVLEFNKRASMDGDAPCALKRVHSSLRLDPVDVSSRISLLERESDLFHLTGGVHAAALSDASGVVARFEDVGRHNALDKLVGWCIMNDVHVDDKTLLFSGRVPQEIILKAIRLGVPVVVSPGAPTSLSVDLAEEYGITLIGFAKRGRFNVYSHAERIAGAEEVAL